IQHSSYTMKIKGARAIQMIGETLKNNLNIEYLIILVEFLLKGLYGRVYEGKECFLRAMETICTYCKCKKIDSARFDFIVCRTSEVRVIIYSFFFLL
ncbi:unnamed protein product, partial [Adineta steineri]